MRASLKQTGIADMINKYQHALVEDVLAVVGKPKLHQPKTEHDNFTPAKKKRMARLCKLFFMAKNG